MLLDLNAVAEAGVANHGHGHAGLVLYLEDKRDNDGDDDAGYYDNNDACDDDCDYYAV